MQRFTTELAKAEPGTIATSGPSISLCTEPGDSCGQINLFLPRSPLFTD